MVTARSRRTKREVLTRMFQNDLNKGIFISREEQIGNDDEKKASQINPVL
jgi:hypothetical protein